MELRLEKYFSNYYLYLPFHLRISPISYYVLSPTWLVVSPYADVLHVDGVDGLVCSRAFYQTEALSC